MIQENSPIHKSKIVQDWIKSRNDIIVLHWHPLSPDLNPIENVQKLTISNNPFMDYKYHKIII